MFRIRRAAERGHFDHGWLDTYHTFSFAEYQDPEQMGFQSLRVINEDRVKGGHGFPTHPHQDMEILTYVLEGSLEHKDSLGTGSVISPGEVQLMTAGTGNRHSEFNPSKDKPVHLLQIWIVPDKRELKPDYRQKGFPVASREDRFCLVASKDAREGSLVIHQDVDVFVSSLNARTEIVHPIKAKRHAWVQVANGVIEVNGQVLSDGDGIAFSGEPSVRLKAVEASQILLFDLA